MAQLPNNAPSLTTPDQAAEESPELTEGLVLPTFVEPEDFEIEFAGLDGGPAILGEGTTDIKVTSFRARSGTGETLRSQKAALATSAGNKRFLVECQGKVELQTANGLEIFADEATLDEGTGTITFRGNVAAYQGTAVHRGSSAVYDYRSKTLLTKGLRTSFAPVLLEAGQFQAITRRDGKTIYQGHQAGVTTHDARKPNYWLRGDEVTVVPDELVRYDNARLYLGDIPVLWLPSLTQEFDGEFNYRPTPGSRTNWGPYLLNAYSHKLGGITDPVTGLRQDASFRATWNADLYWRRGLGTGLRIENLDQKENPNLGWLSLYYIYDLDPSLRRSSEPRINFDTQNRFALQLRQRINANWLPRATGHADANLTFLSDRFYLEDFDPDAYRSDFQPDNTVSLSQQWGDAHLLTAWTRLQLNDFYQTDTRYPEVALDQVRRPLFGSAFLHESQSHFGIYKEDLADPAAADLIAEATNPLTTPARQAEIQTLLESIGFARLHTYHELSLPLKLDSGLHLTPRIGAGHTRYSNLEGNLDNFSRTHLHASLDASFKLTKPYPELVSRRLGLDSALHVVQPYATATFLATNDTDPTFRPLDRLSPSTRPRALTPARYAALDDLADWQILRLGVRNTLLTRRDSNAQQWLSLDTYLDVFGNDPEFDRKVSNLYNNLHWSPLPWLDITMETQFPLFSDSNFTEFATGLYYMPSSDTEIGLRHRFLKDHPILQDSNRLELRAYHRLNEEWGLGSRHIWEFADSTLEFQQYSIHRNLDSWAVSLGLFSRDNLQRDEYGLMLGFTLTDFPSISLPLRVDQ